MYVSVCMIATLTAGRIACLVVCVYMYICMHARLCVCMYVCLYAYMTVCMCVYVCMPLCGNVCMCVCMRRHVCIYVCMRMPGTLPVPNTHATQQTQIHKPIHIQKYTHVPVTSSVGWACPHAFMCMGGAGTQIKHV